MTKYIRWKCSKCSKETPCFCEMIEGCVPESCIGICDGTDGKWKRVTTVKHQNKRHRTTAMDAISLLNECVLFFPLRSIPVVLQHRIKKFVKQHQ